jgi:hypothetical protein
MASVEFQEGMENIVNVGVRGFVECGFDGIGPENVPSAASVVQMLNPKFKRR